MQKHILDQQIAGISERLQQLDRSTAEAVFAGAAVLASEGMQGLHEKTRALVNALHSTGRLNNHEVNEAMALAEAADDRYFELQSEESQSEESLRWFAEARLLRGMALAFGRYPNEGIVDALYELTKTVDDPGAVVEFIASKVRQVRGG